MLPYYASFAKFKIVRIFHQSYLPPSIAYTHRRWIQISATTHEIEYIWNGTEARSIDDRLFSIGGFLRIACTHTISPGGVGGGGIERCAVAGRKSKCTCCIDLTAVVGSAYIARALLTRRSDGIHKRIDGRYVPRPCLKGTNITAISNPMVGAFHVLDFVVFDRLSFSDSLCISPFERPVASWRFKFDGLKYAWSIRYVDFVSGIYWWVSSILQGCNFSKIFCCLVC